MAIDRPTFHEAWYRVCDLKPRLVSSVRVYRQHFRGQMWFVLEDRASNQYSRISEEAYDFIALLDGRRTVGQAWQICNDKLGDSALTQGEVITLLGNLYTSNLLKAEVPPDAESLFNRYKKRKSREIKSYLSNLLFVRIPLFDPDRILERWLPVVGKLYSKTGFAIWVCLLCAGGFFLFSNWQRFAIQTGQVLSADNLILLFASLWVVKIVHEFSHSFACKRFGTIEGGRGEVHTLGIMLLVFAPLPYMDASSAWAFRKKSHRVIVGAAGMLAELAVAAIAAIVWANTSSGAINAVAYNIIFIASVSTLIFNGNPLLRFDGYYILSDLIEIPNLNQRATGYLKYLVLYYCWGVRQVTNPANTVGERIWFVFYGIASTVYRVFIAIRIALFLNERLPEELFFVVPVLIAGSVTAWLFLPLGKFVRFLLTGSQLARTRARAIMSTAASAVIIVALMGIIRLPDYARVEGIVEPAEISVAYAGVDGFLIEALVSQNTVEPGSLLSQQMNVELETEMKRLLAQKKEVVIRKQLAAAEQQLAAVQALDEKLKALDEKIARVDAELAQLDKRAQVAGWWISPALEHGQGVYVKKGEKLGVVASLDEIVIRATARQNVAAMLIEQAQQQVEMRVKGRAKQRLGGVVEQFLPAGSEQLPSRALSYAAGGSMPTKRNDPEQVSAAERFFEIIVRPEADSDVRLLSGQRVVVRFRMEDKPLALQWWRSARQLFQRRFRI